MKIETSDKNQVLCLIAVTLETEKVKKIGITFSCKCLKLVFGI